MRWIFVLFAVFLATTGCSLDFAVLNPVGKLAFEERSLLITSVLLMLIIIVPVIIMIAIFTYKYRAKNSNSNYNPEWSHNTLLEVIWWMIPCIIIVILGTITWITSHQLDPYKELESEEKPIVIQVVALDWKWLFILPEYGIATINSIQIPVNVPINFRITADAPMNSFAIPKLGGQIYAMQGMETKLHLIANHVGVLDGYSANYSGEGFSGMKFNVVVGSKDEFKEWIKSIKSSGKALTKDVYNDISKPSKDEPILYFSSVKDDLYIDIITKFGHAHGSEYDSSKSSTCDTCINHSKK